MAIDEQGRIEPPEAADELDTLVGFLEFHRATFELKTGELDDVDLHASPTTSSMTLGGMLKHLAYVENWWFRQWLHDWDPIPPWDAVDWQADEDWDWHSAAADSGEDLRALWRTATERSRAALAQALAVGGLEQHSARRRRDGSPVDLRWILVHMIEEYCRHNGHADLLRESLDGSTGE